MLIEYVESGSYGHCREGAGGSLKAGALSAGVSADPVNRGHSFETESVKTF